jgi:predicted nucleic acid-binding protein
VIVVDTNLIIYLFLTSERTSQAENALRKDPFWAVPLLWRSEFRNVLVVYLRKKLIRLDEAQHIMEEAVRLVRGREYEIASFQVLSLAAASTCSAYDCEFVALAKDLNVPLVTVDKQILAQFPDSAISLEKFISG